jgi:phosphoglycerol transferase MdoB-like AlkP superfamily enzyme
MAWNKMALRIPRPFFVVAALLLLKTWLLRYFLFGQLELRHVLPDLASILAIAGLIEALWPEKSKKMALWSLNLLVSFLFFAATVYFSYFSTVPTFSALNELDQAAGVKSSILAIIKWQYCLYFADIVLAAAVWAVNRLKGGKPAVWSSGRTWKLGVLSAAAVGLFISLLYIHHGKAIRNELALAKEIGFFNYQVTSALRASEASAKARNATVDELSRQLNELKRANGIEKTGRRVAFGSMLGKNLIVVQLEAVQNFPIHLKLNGQEVTPVMNQLADNGYYFPKIFQQIGQGNTSDAEFLSNTAIYPTATGAMSTLYGNRDLPSLPKLLKKYGYVSETFHVNDVTFWDRHKLYPALGFDRYHDKPAFQNDQFNSYGASDVELYRVAVNRMVELKQEGTPFYMQLITVSSHHPFKIPQEAQRLSLPEDMAGTQLGDYLQAVHYVDYAVGELIQMLKDNGLYEDTMIVIYGDHFGLQPQENKPEDISRKLGIAYHDLISRYNIPLIIHVPGKSPRQVIDRVGGQADILPTVANLLGISLKKENFLSFGSDLLNVKRNVVGVRYYMPTGSFFTDEIMFVPGISFDDGTAVDLNTLQPVEDISRFRSDYDYIMDLLSLSDTYVESLPRRDSEDATDPADFMDSADTP